MRIIAEHIPLMRGSREEMAYEGPDRCAGGEEEHRKVVTCIGGTVHLETRSNGDTGQALVREDGDQNT